MRILLTLLAALTLAVLAACGGDDDDASPTPTTTGATTTPSAPQSTDGTDAPSATPCQTFPLDIYRVDIASGFSTTVAHGVNGRWSPNGSFFAYYVSPGSQACDQGLVIDAAISHQRQYVFTLPVWDWAWSPDSTSVAIASYTSGETNHTDGLYRVSVPTGEVLKMVDGPVTSLSWSPVNDVVAFALEGSAGVHTVGTDGNADYQSPHPGDGIRSLAWAPSGDHVAAVSYQGDTTSLQLLSIPDGTWSEVASSDQNITTLQWSESSALKYEVSGQDTNEIWVLPAGSTTPQKLADGQQAAFSPDGSHIAYVAGWCTTFDIAVIAPDGSGNTIVSPGTAAGPQLEPTWSPDGTLIAFHSDATYTVTPDGATLTRVRDAMESLAWSPSGQFLTGQAIGGRGLCEG